MTHFYLNLNGNSTCKKGKNRPVFKYLKEVSVSSVWNKRCHIITTFLKHPKCNSCKFASTHSVWITSNFLNIIFAGWPVFFYSKDVKANDNNQGVHSTFNYFCSLANRGYSIYSVSTQCSCIFTTVVNCKECFFPWVTGNNQGNETAD